MQRHRLLDPDLDRTFNLSDGRAISYREFGAVDGRAILALHGTPGSRLKYRVAHDEAAARGLRIIAPDRWGYGWTLPPKQPSLASYGNDMVELLAHCGVDQFSVVGISGGGPFAAALAASLPDRATRLALVAPVGRVADPGSPESAHAPADRMRSFHKFCFVVLPRIPGATRVVFGFYRLAVFAAPANAVRLALVRSDPADKRVMSTSERRRSLGQTFAAGLSKGSTGPAIDLRLFAKPWGIDLSSITCPSRLWIGDEDLNVPMGAAITLAQDITGTETFRIPDQGHFWISENFSDVLDWLGA